MKLTATLFTIGLIISLCCFPHKQLHAQWTWKAEEPVFRPHAIYADITPTFLILYVGASAYYEYSLGTIGDVNKMLFAGICRAGIAGHAYWEGNDVTLMPQLGMMLGARKNYFELFLGPGFNLSDASNFNGIVPSGSIGYRYQKPRERLIIRAGLGWPEILYAGIGLSFGR